MICVRVAAVFEDFPFLRALLKLTYCRQSPVALSNILSTKNENYGKNIHRPVDGRPPIDFNIRLTPSSPYSHPANRDPLFFSVDIALGVEEEMKKKTNTERSWARTVHVWDSTTERGACVCVNCEPTPHRVQKSWIRARAIATAVLIPHSEIFVVQPITLSLPLPPSLLLLLPKAIQTTDSFQHLCQTFRDYCVVRTQNCATNKLEFFHSNLQHKPNGL